MENNVPEAVRLGESMMSEIGAKMPRDMALQLTMHHYMLAQRTKMERYQ